MIWRLDISKTDGRSSVNKKDCFFLFQKQKILTLMATPTIILIIQPINENPWLQISLLSGFAFSQFLILIDNVMAVIIDVTR